ncbi:MAG: ComF family protein [Saprospiraceae bacterium]|nr:ComF family protein [Saprospiraceae bacterium]
MLATFLRPFSDLFDLIYPRICPACSRSRSVRNGLFCIDCLAVLPETGYHLVQDNPFERHFWGRIPLQAGAAYLFFIPGGRTQGLLHAIKYQGQRHVAEEIGRTYGRQLAACSRFQNLDAIVPVPLHWRRQHRRGFNQSAAFARGLGDALDVPVVVKALQRTRQTATQTRKSRLERIDNMQAAFVLKQTGSIAGRHVLLVDDVLTTGATLEACAQVLLALSGTKVSMVTIACGRI